MNFLNLEYFVAAAENMNFTKAARQLYISQPSLSNHIAKLEEELGVELFDRNPPLTLTDAGASFLKNARHLLSMKEDTERELQDIRDFKGATLKIGVTHIRGTYMLPPILTEFRKNYPRVRFQLLEGTTESITEELYRGNIDLTLGHANGDTERIHSEALYEEPLLVIVSERILQEQFTEKERKRILMNEVLPIETFAKCPFVKMKDPSWIGVIFTESCKTAGFVPDIRLETQNITTMVSVCKAGYGVGLSPAIFVKQDILGLNKGPGGKLFSFPLDFPGARKVIAANYLKNKYQTVVARRFIEIAKQQNRQE